MNPHTPESEKIIKTLFEEHFNRLVLFSFRYVNDYDEATEIVQDVFVKVWQHFDKVRAVKDLKKYLFKAVRNSSLNYLKHVKVKAKYIRHLETVGETVERPHEEAILKEETVQRIHQAINKLPPSWREAFLLSKFNQLKYNEIAEEMNISPKTVEKYISKAFKFLRMELKNVHFLSIFL